MSATQPAFPGDECLHVPGLEPPSGQAVYLGLVDYADAWRLQLALVDAVLTGRAPDLLLLCQHPDVITVGRRQKARDNILLSHFPTFEVERGGDATYHGPGQLVGYPILKLRPSPDGRPSPSERDLHRYLRALEGGLIDACATVGVAAGRKQGATGVWTPKAVPAAAAHAANAAQGADADDAQTAQAAQEADDDAQAAAAHAANAAQDATAQDADADRAHRAQDADAHDNADGRLGPIAPPTQAGDVALPAEQRKIASMGIAVRRWITFHGFALNVTTDLSRFFAINPCGFRAEVMTSLSQLCPKESPPPTVEGLLPATIACLGARLNRRFQPESPDWLQSLVSVPAS